MRYFRVLQQNPLIKVEGRHISQLSICLMEDSVNMQFKFTRKILDKRNEINHSGGQKEHGGLLWVAFQI